MVRSNGENIYHWLGWDAESYIHKHPSYQYTKLGPMEEKGSVLMYTLFKISFWNVYKATV